MSKENKFNPGTYTQAGRLSPDDAARERTRQRAAARKSSRIGTASPRKRKGGVSK
jgi:hypothetical protein